MSNEISYQFQLMLNNTKMKDSFASGGLTANQSVAGLVRNAQVIPTTPTALDLPELGVPGFAVFQNLDTANFIEIGSYVIGEFYPFVMLKPGEQCLFRLSSNAPVAQANTASVKLFYIIYSA